MPIIEIATAPESRLAMTNYKTSLIPLCNTISISKDNEAARRRHRRRILYTLRKPTTQPTKLAEESKMV